MTCRECGMTIGWDCECDPEYQALVNELALGEPPCGEGVATDRNARSEVAGTEAAKARDVGANPRSALGEPDQCSITQSPSRNGERRASKNTASRSALAARRRPNVSAKRCARFSEMRRWS